MFFYNPELGYRPQFKMRPCLVYQTGMVEEKFTVYLLPISHTSPPIGEETNYVFLDNRIRKRLGLDEHDQWICCDQMNKFVWDINDKNILDPLGKTAVRCMPEAILHHVKANFDKLFRSQPRKVWIGDR